MDEWNFWYGNYIYGELGVQYHHKDALGVAIGLHEYFRNSDLYFMANYAQTVNVIGCIKTSRTAASFETTGLVLKLYRHNYGTLPVAVTGDIAPVDVAAALTQDRKALTVGVVNPMAQGCEITMNLKGAQLAGNGTLGLIVHSDPMAYNEPGKEPNVVIKEKLITDVSNILNVPPLSVSLYRLDLK
jgi:alpha-N-arabinofuranosidase